METKTGVIEHAAFGPGPPLFDAAHRRDVPAMHGFALAMLLSIAFWSLLALVIASWR